MPDPIISYLLKGKPEEDRRFMAIFGGFPFYHSTGRNSALPGTWLPFSGVMDGDMGGVMGKVTDGGRLLKPGDPYTFFKLLQFEESPGSTNYEYLQQYFPQDIIDLVCPSDNDKACAPLMRFGTMETLVISKMIGGGHWDTVDGTKLAALLESRYKSFCDELKTKHGDTINKILKQIKIYEQLKFLKQPSSLKLIDDVSGVNKFIEENIPTFKLYNVYRLQQAMEAELKKKGITESHPEHESELQKLKFTEFKERLFFDVTLNGAEQKERAVARPAHGMRFFTATSAAAAAAVPIHRSEHQSVQGSQLKSEMLKALEISLKNLTFLAKDFQDMHSKLVNSSPENLGLDIKELDKKLQNVQLMLNYYGTLKQSLESSTSSSMEDMVGILNQIVIYPPIDKIMVEEDMEAKPPFTTAIFPLISLNLFAQKTLKLTFEPGKGYKAPDRDHEEDLGGTTVSFKG